MKYVKKPVEVEAFQYDGDFFDSNGKPYVPDWAMRALEDRTMDFNPSDPHRQYYELFIYTLEGAMHVSIGDYIIKGIDGEIYPCKPTIFEKTYEKVKI